MKSKMRIKRVAQCKLSLGKIRPLLKHLLKVNRNGKIFIDLHRNADLDADQSNHSDENDSSTLFQRRTEPLRPLVQPSPLTELIRSSTAQQNPFIAYAKFDGTVRRSPTLNRSINRSISPRLVEHWVESIEESDDPFQISSGQNAGDRLSSCDSRRSDRIYLLQVHQ